LVAGVGYGLVGADAGIVGEGRGMGMGAVGAEGIGCCADAGRPLL
jgi:hypothetical protein